MSPQPKRWLTPLLALGTALSLVACAAPGAGLPQASLTLDGAQQGPTGSLVLQLGGLPYQLQSLADLATLRVTLKRSGSQDLVRSVEASALQAGQGRVSFEALSVGPVAVEVEGLNAQGQLLGFARADAAVSAGETARVSLRLAVGGPATQGGLGLDLVVADDPASHLLRPLKLTRAQPLVSELQDGPILDLKLVESSGQKILLAYRNKLISVNADFTASQTVIGFIGSQEIIGISPRAAGGFLRCTKSRVCSMTAASGAYRHEKTTTWTGEKMVSSADGEIYWLADDSSGVYVHGDHLPPFGSAEAMLPWGISSVRKRIDSLQAGRGKVAELFGTDAMEQPGSVMVHDTHQVVAIDERGGSSFLAQSSEQGPGPSPQTNHTTLTDLNQAINTSIAQGKVPGFILSACSDKRGGFWIASHLSLSQTNVMAIFRRSPSGSLHRAWGPVVSGEEVNSILGGESLGLNTFGLVIEPFSSPNLLLWAEPEAAAGDSKRGAFVFTNGKSIFVFEEQAATAP